MRILVLCLCIASLGLSGCSVCVGACKKNQGRAVAGLVPNADGTIQVQTCTLTTEGKGSTVDACQAKLIPSPTPQPPR